MGLPSWIIESHDMPFWVGLRRVSIQPLEPWPANLPVGAFLTSLGGSLMLLPPPVVCFVALVRHRYAFGGSLALW